MGRGSRRWRATVAVAALGALAGGQAAAEGPAPAARVTVADLGWLAGAWTGTVGDDPVEELWSTARDGTMVGAFRWLGERTLYELLLLEDTPEGPLLRLRHFDPGLRPWEDGREALVFRLVAAGEGTATFRFGEGGEGTPLVYRRTADGGLAIELTLVQGGKPVEHHFRLRPAGDPPGGR